MNSLERVKLTIAHKEPDRVPIGEWGIDHDHVSRIIGRPTFWRNRRAQTLAMWEGRRDEVVEGMKRDYVDLIEALDYDVIPVELVPRRGFKVEDPPKKIDDETWQDSAGRIYKYAASNDSIMRVNKPPPGKESITDEEIARYRASLLDIDESQYELIDFIADRYASTRAVCFRGVADYGVLVSPFGGDGEHQLITIASAPEELMKLYDVAVDYDRILLDHCRRKGVFIGMTGHDYGGTNSCILNPKLIRRVFMPLHARVAALTREMGMIPFFHCCGAIYDILEDWMNAGYVGYQSIQGSAGMDMAVIKQRYGDRLTLWTGIQCETLVAATPKKAVEEVKRSLEICMPGGGFIFGSTNSVQFGAKTGNYLKAIETVRKYGKY